MKFAVFPLSAFVKVDLQKILHAFVDLGVSPWSILRNWFAISRIITQYRLGNHTATMTATDTFKAALKKLFPKLSTDTTFDTAFNKMCDVRPLTFNAFAEIRQMQEREVRIYLVAGTNDLHWNFLSARADHNIPGEHFLSHRRHKLETALMAEVFANMKEQSEHVFKNDIGVLYYKPKLPNIFKWTKSDWILALPYALEYINARLYTRKLQAQAKKQGFTLVEFQPEGEKPKLIASFKKTMRWAIDQQVSLTPQPAPSPSDDMISSLLTAAAPSTLTTQFNLEGRSFAQSPEPRSTFEGKDKPKFKSS